MDRFLRALPFEAKKLAGQSNPKDAAVLVDILEGYQAAQGLLRSGRPTKTETVIRPTERPRADDHAWRPTAPTPVEPPRRRPLMNPDSRRCYECGEQGHIAWNCPHREDVPMPTASASETGRPCGLLTTCWGQESGGAPLTPVKVNGKDATALLDSGSAVTLVRPDFARLPHLNSTLSVTCIHGETREYPTTALDLQTTGGRYAGTAGVVPDLPVQVLIGRDADIFQRLWHSWGGRRKTRGPGRSPPQKAPSRGGATMWVPGGGSRDVHRAPLGGGGQ